MAHFFKADTELLASLLRSLLYPADELEHASSGTPQDLWPLVDTLPEELVAAVLAPAPLHPEEAIQGTPEKWHAALLRANLLTADCRLETVLADCCTPDAAPTAADGDAAANDVAAGADVAADDGAPAGSAVPAELAAGSALRGLRLSAAAVSSDAATAALAACPELEWLAVTARPWRNRAAALGAAPAAARAAWRTLEALVPFWHHPINCSALRASARPHALRDAVSSMAMGATADRTAVSSLTRGFWRHLGAVTQLRALDMSSCCLSLPQARKLEQTLRRLAALELLSVCAEAGAPDVAAAAVQLPRLHTLALEGGVHSGDSANVLPAATVAAMTGLRSLLLENMALQHAGLFPALAALPRLRVLELIRVDVAPTSRLDAPSVDACAPGAALRRVACVEIDLQRGDFDGLLPLLKLQSGLRELCLAPCAFSASAAIDLWGVLQSHTALEHLHVMQFWNSREEVTGLNVCMPVLLGGCTRLTHLAFAMASGDEACSCMPELPRLLPALRGLRLVGSTEDEMVLPAAFLQLPSLTHVHFELQCSFLDGFPPPLALLLTAPALAHLRVLCLPHTTAELWSEGQSVALDVNAGLADVLPQMLSLHTFTVSATRAVAHAAEQLAALPRLRSLTLVWVEDCASSPHTMPSSALTCLSALSRLHTLALDSFEYTDEPTVPLAHLLGGVSGMHSLQVLSSNAVVRITAADVRALPTAPLPESLRVLDWGPARREDCHDGVDPVEAACQSVLGRGRALPNLLIVRAVSRMF